MRPLCYVLFFALPLSILGCAETSELIACGPIDRSSDSVRIGFCADSVWVYLARTDTLSLTILGPLLERGILRGEWFHAASKPGGQLTVRLDSCRTNPHPRGPRPSGDHVDSGYDDIYVYNIGAIYSTKDPLSFMVAAYDGCHMCYYFLQLSGRILHVQFKGFEA
jgi:hypothetical protein